MRTPLGAQRRHRYRLQRRTAGGVLRKQYTHLSALHRYHRPQPRKRAETASSSVSACAASVVYRAAWTRQYSTGPARPDVPKSPPHRTGSDGDFLRRSPEPREELDVLFAAFERLPPRKFVLIVAGDGPGAGEVRRYAAARSHVRILDTSSRELRSLSPTRHLICS